VTAHFRIALIAGSLALTLAPMTAHAHRAQDKAAAEERGREACTQDAQMYCSEYFPDRDKVGHCLKRNSKRLSEACRIMIRRFK
jgi:hypothetical protein